MPGLPTGAPVAAYARPGTALNDEYNTHMPYPEQFVAPMREELTRFGVEELRTAGDVDQAVAQDGTTMIVVNSVCGCAAGKARPGIAMALLQNERKPEHVGTVFAEYLNFWLLSIQ